MEFYKLWIILCYELQVRDVTSLFITCRGGWKLVECHSELSDTPSVDSCEDHQEGSGVGFHNIAYQNALLLNYLSHIV